MRSLPAILSLFLALAVWAGPRPAAAQAVAPVVLELYTSQGCSACPPADALLTELASMDGVIALSLHVTYWDYMGWTDGFGRPEHTARQKAYAVVGRSRTLYTPQVVVQGEDRLKGHDAKGILADVARRQKLPAAATLTAERSGAGLALHMAPAAGAVGAADVHVVSYLPSRTVDIEKGDNAGREVTYTNVVTDWRTVGRWDGTGPFDLKLDSVAEGPLAVIVQRAEMGSVLAAALLP